MKSNEKDAVIHDYRDLRVWIEGMELAQRTYRLTRDFPKEEAFGLVTQMRRAAVSMPSNIAEGFGRQTRQSFVQFLRVSQGSLKDLETQVELSRRLGMLDEMNATRVLESCERRG